MPGQDCSSIKFSLSESCSPPISCPEKLTDLPASVAFGGDMIQTDSSSARETEYTASNEGVEVEAIEFNQPKRMDDVGHTFYCPRKLLLLILAFLVIMIVSTITGFLVLKGKKRISSSAAFLVTGDSKEVVEVLNVTNTIENTGGFIPIDTEIFVMDLEDTIDTNITEPQVSISLAPTHSPSSVPTVSPTQRPTSDVTTEQSSSGTSRSIPPSEDSNCTNHDLVVSSSCASDTEDALSTASYCFASKRDGDWYWLRSRVAEDNSRPDYDLWDYTEEIKGQYSFLGLPKGDYIISLVRDSMQPYDEIISHEFSVLECE